MPSYRRAGVAGAIGSSLGGFSDALLRMAERQSAEQERDALRAEERQRWEIGRKDDLRAQAAQQEESFVDRMIRLQTNGYTPTAPAEGAAPDITLPLPGKTGGEAALWRRPEPAYDPASDPAVLREQYYRENRLGTYAPPRVAPTPAPSAFDPATDPAVQREQFYRDNGLGRYAESPSEPSGAQDRLAQMESLAELNVTSPNPQAQTAFLFSFMKLIDDGGAVREGDIDMLSATQSLRQRVANAIQRGRSGQVLTQEQMDGFLEAARALAGEAGAMPSAQSLAGPGMPSDAARYPENPY